MKHAQPMTSDRDAWLEWTKPFRAEGIHIVFNLDGSDPDQLPRQVSYGLLCGITNLADILRAGTGTHRGLRTARANQTKKAGEQCAGWQRQADEFWAKNPRLSKRSVARLIDPKCADHIRRTIENKVGHR